MIGTGVQVQAYDEENKPPGLFFLSAEHHSQIPQSFLKAFWKNQEIKTSLELFDDCIFLKSQKEVSCLNFNSDIFFTYNLSKCQILFQHKQTKIKEIFSVQNQVEFYNFIGKLKNKCSQQGFKEKYDFVAQISISKNCQIWKIKKKQDLSIFAVKILLNSSKVQQQIEILKQLKHPNLIYLHEYFIEPDNTVYVVMDYEDGSLLDKMKSQFELTYKQKLKITIDMLNALQFLRIKGIVHRDIKPENILFSKKDGNFKITDFGLAMHVGDLINKRSGTPGYMAPQLLEDECEAEANITSDIYSMGLTLYEMFTKKQYYSGSDNQQILQNNIKAASFRRKSYPSQDPYKIQKKLLEKMIRKKPEDRNNSLQIMQSSIYSKINLYHGKQSIPNSPQKSSSSEEQNFIDTVKKIFKIKSAY